MDIIHVCSLILSIIMYISKVLQFSYCILFYLALYLRLRNFFLPKTISNQNLNKTSVKRRKSFSHDSKGKGTIDGIDTQVGGPNTQLLM